MDSYFNYSEFLAVSNVFREHNEMKEKIKYPENVVGYTIWEKWKYVVSVVRKILQTKILVAEELNKIDQCFYQIVVFFQKENQGSLKIKKQVTWQILVQRTS